MRRPNITKGAIVLGGTDVCEYIEHLEELLAKANTIPCSWCNKTSEQIDSLEYENETLKAENEVLRAEHWRNVKPTLENNILSEMLSFNRANRPDEWTMDEYIRLAKVLEIKAPSTLLNSQINQLQKKVTILKAENKGVEEMIENWDCMSSGDLVFAVNQFVKALSTHKEDKDRG